MPDAPVNRRGRLLVAAPSLIDPNFRRAVVLMLEHSPDGALGVVLNRPSTTRAVDVLPEPLGQLLPEDELVHEGGPVQPEAVIVLADFRNPEQAADAVLGSVGIVNPHESPAALAGALSAVRAFGGYAGWSEGQLEQEIAEEAWIDAPCRAEDVFTDDPQHLWARALERKGGRWRIIARLPEDPSVN